MFLLIYDAIFFVMMNRINFPDILRVLTDGAVTGKLTCRSHIIYTHAQPSSAVLIWREDSETNDTKENIKKTKKKTLKLG